MGVHSGNLVKSLVDDVLMPAVLQPALKAAGAADIAQLATAG
jgi:large-conductance mechanosensitive channel